MKIILVGGPAAGKTTIGKAIAQKWNLTFADTDHWIETQCNKSVSRIFAEEGEAVFREWETQALQALLEQDQVVIATGGGIVKRNENRTLLKQQSHVIYLNVSIKTQLERTQGDQSRPLLQGQDKAAILTRLQQERDPLYRDVAKLVINADLPVAEILEQVWIETQNVI